MGYDVFLRHGETELNFQNRCAPEKRVVNGQVETPLTTHGRKQARNAGFDILSRSYLDIRHVLCSDLGRTVETADIVLRVLHLNLPIIKLPALRERFAGLFEGKLEVEIYTKHPEYRDDPRFNRYRVDFAQRAPGGENYTDVTERSRRALQEHQIDCDRLIVSHLNTIRCMVGDLLGLPQQQILQLPIPNAMPIILRRDGGRCELVDG